MNRYYKNGQLDDEFGTGVSLEIRDDGVNSLTRSSFVTSDGVESLGYLATEITEAEYIEWKQRIDKPDMVTYFPGVFPKVGVVSKSIYEKIQAEQHARKIANLSVTRASALITLAKHGIFKEMIYGKIAELPESEAAIAKLWFDEALSFKRSNKYIKQIGELLSLTEQQLDEFFIEATSIN